MQEAQFDTEQVMQSHSLDVLFANLLELEPKLVTNFVPENKDEQKELFLSGNQTKPENSYSKVDAIDFDARREQIRSLGDLVVNHDDVDDKQRAVYEQFVERYIAQTNFLELAHKVKHLTGDEKEAAKADFMRLNIELNGQPEEDVYRSLLAEKLAAIDAKQLGPRAEAIRNELHELTGVESPELSERFRPSQETIEWMSEVADSLYGDMLQHVPEQQTFADTEIQSLFQEIIDQEFPGELKSDDNPDGWTVDIEPAQSINVKTFEKRIVIPTGRLVKSESEMRHLVVHELGVHFLRSVMGESTDLLPFRIGLNNYYDSEEGLGKVMEQAIDGKYSEAGADHYITAGLAFLDGKDFRETFEIKWRLSALAAVKDGQDIADDKIDSTRSKAYDSVMRSFRGTDELPWFKDLAYFNGTANAWRHLDEIRGDDLKFKFVLLGKADPSNPDHEHIMLETSSI